MPSRPKNDEEEEIMTAGRPRKHDRENLKIELLQWAALPDSLNLNKFCCTRNPPLSPVKLLAFVKEDEEFREAYEAAKTFLAYRREEGLVLGTMHQAAYNKNAHVYDLIMKYEDREGAEFESNLRKQENNQKETTINLMVPDGLRCGANIPTETLPTLDNQSSK